MAYDEGLAQRIFEILADEPDLVDKKMFGGIAFMVLGNMAVGVIDDALMVRVGPDGYDEALQKPGVREFDFTGRPMKGWVVVEAGAIAEDDDLNAWVQQGLSFALSLPPK